MTKKSNLSKTAWDVFQYSVIPLGLAVGMFNGASDVLGNDLANAVMSGLNGGGLGTMVANQAPLVHHRGIEGVHHVKHRLMELEGKLKHLISDKQMLEHLGLKGGGFGTGKAPTHSQVDRVNKRSSKWTPYMLKLAALMTLGAGAYYGNEYINNKLIDGMNSALGMNIGKVGSGMKGSGIGSGIGKKMKNWLPYLVPLTIGASALMNYNDGLFEKDLLVSDDSMDYLFGDGLGGDKGKWKYDPKNKAPAKKLPTWASNFISLNALAALGGLAYGSYGVMSSAKSMGGIF